MATSTTTKATPPTATGTGATAAASFASGIRRLYVQGALERGGALSLDACFLSLLLLFELALGTWIVRRVRYTEIDWTAYMEEVTAYEGGERNYEKIRGGTGPLVYPAGFLYLFSFLKRWTDEGRGVRKAQYAFLIMYLATQYVVLLLYQERVTAIRNQFYNSYYYCAYPASTTQEQKQQQGENDATDRGTSGAVDTVDDDSDERRRPPATAAMMLGTAHRIWFWRLAMALLCLSKRAHSIFLLRLFNDCPAMLLLYGSIFLFTRHRWFAGCVVFSLAVSVKMNVLLFAPGLLLLLLQATTLPPSSSSSEDLFPAVTILLQRLGLGCALPQLVLGAPFLFTYPVQYLRKAFELDRVFFYMWTVNWKFVREDVFLSKGFAFALLVLHLVVLGICARRFWTAAATARNAAMKTTAPTTSAAIRQQVPLLLSPHYIVYTLLLSNFIGICFARTLHYQFYIWYFHALPYLLWSYYDDNFNKESGHINDEPSTAKAFSGALRVLIRRIAILMGIEYAFLTFPATPWSSAVLQICHFAVLVPCSGYFRGPPTPIFVVDKDDVDSRNHSQRHYDNKEKGQ